MKSFEHQVVVLKRFETEKIFGLLISPEQNVRTIRCRCNGKRALLCRDNKKNRDGMGERRRQVSVQSAFAVNRKQLNGALSKKQMIAGRQQRKKRAKWRMW